MGNTVTAECNNRCRASLDCPAFLIDYGLEVTTMRTMMMITIMMMRTMMTTMIMLLRLPLLSHCSDWLRTGSDFSFIYGTFNCHLSWWLFLPGLKVTMIMTVMMTMRMTQILMVFFLPGLLSAWLDLRGWSGAVGAQWREDQLLWEGFSLFFIVFWELLVPSGEKTNYFEKVFLNLLPFTTDYWDHWPIFLLTTLTTD